jgi:hypothetical protein
MFTNAPKINPTIPEIAQPPTLELGNTPYFPSQIIFRSDVAFFSTAFRKVHRS